MNFNLAELSILEDFYLSWTIYYFNLSEISTE